MSQRHFLGAVEVVIDYVPDFICTETVVSRELFNEFRDRLKAINEGETMYGGMVPPSPKPVTDCPECKGRGKILLFSHEHTCNNCVGSGKVTKKEDDNNDIYVGCGF